MASVVDITPSQVVSIAQRMQSTVQNYTSKSNSLSEIVASASSKWIGSGASQAAAQNVSKALEQISGMTKRINQQLTYVISYAETASSVDRQGTSDIGGV